MTVKRYCRQLYDSLLPIVVQLRGLVDERAPSKDRIEKLDLIRGHLPIIARWADAEWQRISEEKPTTKTKGQE